MLSKHCNEYLGSRPPPSFFLGAGLEQNNPLFLILAVEQPCCHTFEGLFFLVY